MHLSRQVKQAIRKGREKFRLEERPSAYLEYFYDPMNWLELTIYSLILTVAGLRTWAEYSYDDHNHISHPGHWEQARPPPL